MSSSSASLTDRRIKITVPGPFTMAQQAQNDHYARRAEPRARLRRGRQRGAPRPEGGRRRRRPDRRALPAGAAGAGREYALEAIDRALDGIDGETVLHTCFGYAHIVHDRLAGYPFLRELNDCAATHLSLEAAQPDLDPAVLRDVPDKVIVLGVLDLGSSRGRDARRRRRADQDGRSRCSRPSASSSHPTAA